jgi:hypothetical protein
MTRQELLKMIEDEVSQISRQPIKEPIVQRPVVNKTFIINEPALKTEEEFDEVLFGKKEKY